MSYVDFDSLVINRSSIDYDELKNIMHHFSAYGVRSFIIAYDVDPEKDFIATVIYNIRNLKNDIRYIKPFGCKVYVAPSVLYRPNTPYEDYVARLRFKRTDKIFLRLPEYCEFSEDEFFKSTNHLLYKLKYMPVFTRFEDVLNTYPNSVSKKIYKTRRAAFCIDVKHLSSRIGTVHAFSAMNGDSESMLVPSISGKFNDYKSPEALFSNIKQHYDRSIYLKFCKYLNSSIRKIFPLK